MERAERFVTIENEHYLIDIILYHIYIMLCYTTILQYLILYHIILYIYII